MNISQENCCNEKLKNKELLERKLISIIRKYGEENFKIVEKPLYFDRGFNDGYRGYMSLFAIPKDLDEETISYGQIGFTCECIRLYDQSNNVIAESITTCYDDIKTPTIVCVYEE